MSTIEQTVAVGGAAVQKAKPRESAVSRIVRFACSVRLGVTLLVLLAAACLVGMLVMQQNVAGFDRYFAELTPAQRLVYGNLGLFDIYHAWYFNALLAGVSMSIILASVDRFPKTWRLISKPKLTVPSRWIREQKNSYEMEFGLAPNETAAELERSMKDAGWKRVQKAEKGGTLYLFAQSGAWNRLGAYPVHVALLTIFFGAFLTAQMGSTGQLPLSPGARSDLMFDTVVELDQASEITKRLPFEVTCTDIQQKLIKKDGPINAMNTIDWITRFTITDETGSHEASVQMNRPYDYRGYRFFQASFTPVGRARSVTIRAQPVDGGESLTVTVPRNGAVELANGTKIELNEFRGNFRIGPEDTNEDTSTYPNPAAVLHVTDNSGATYAAYAFGSQMANIPVASKPIAGFTYQLADFEKAADQHILSVQRDPGATVVYVGFGLLCLTLLGVFCFSHQRVWAAIEAQGGDRSRVVLGGNTNRNANGFEEKFTRFVADLRKKKI